MLLHTLRSEENTWTEADRLALDEKLERSIQQVAAGKTYTADEAWRKLQSLRAAHLAKPD